MTAKSRWTACLYGAAALALALAAMHPAAARQFRGLIPIATPAAERASLPPGAQPVSEVTPLSREQVEPLVRKVIDAWNEPTLDSVLGAGFYDRQRLLDAVDRRVPRDARLEVQSVQGVQTLSQYQLPPDAEHGTRLVSRVSATVRTQIEFELPGAGFQRRLGTNEFILQVTQPAP